MGGRSAPEELAAGRGEAVVVHHGSACAARGLCSDTAGTCLPSPVFHGMCRRSRSCPQVGLRVWPCFLSCSSLNPCGPSSTSHRCARCLFECTSHLGELVEQFKDIPARSEKPGHDTCAAPKDEDLLQRRCIPQSCLGGHGSHLREHLQIPGDAECSAASHQHLAGGRCGSQHFRIELWVGDVPALLLLASSCFCSVFPPRLLQMRGKREDDFLPHSSYVDRALGTLPGGSGKGKLQLPVTP